MAGRSNSKKKSIRYVLGRENFAAISAVEGLKLASASKLRLARTRALSPEQRRAKTIQAFAVMRNRP